MHIILRMQKNMCVCVCVCVREPVTETNPIEIGSVSPPPQPYFE